MTLVPVPRLNTGHDTPSTPPYQVIIYSSFAAPPAAKLIDSNHEAGFLNTEMETRHHRMGDQRNYLKINCPSRRLPSQSHGHKYNQWTRHWWSEGRPLPLLPRTLFNKSFTIKLNGFLIPPFILWNPDIWQGPACRPAPAWWRSSCRAGSASWPRPCAPPSWRCSWGCWAQSAPGSAAAATAGRASCPSATPRTYTAHAQSHTAFQRYDEPHLALADGPDDVAEHADAVPGVGAGDGDRVGEGGAAGAGDPVQLRARHQDPELGAALHPPAVVDGAHRALAEQWVTTSKL